MRTLAGPGTSREASAAAGAKSGRAPALADRVRFALALAAGKGSGAAGRLLNMGGGTSFPGTIARRIDPLVLQKVATASKANKALMAEVDRPAPTVDVAANAAQ